jgi:Mce-associated membrane protein
MAVDADAPDGELMVRTGVAPVDDPAAGSDGPALAGREDVVADGAEDGSDKPPPDRRSRQRIVALALVFGLSATVALATLVGWLGVRTYQSHQAEQQRALFVQVARQSALNLTTISYTEADADVKRILDSATGAFYDDFQNRSKPFIDVVKQAKSKSEGTVTEAGLESLNGDQGQVIVAITVRTSNAGAQQQDPRQWRMRLFVQKVGDTARVSNVEFVP